MNDSHDPSTLVLQLLERVIDSFEKLDITLFLYNARSESRSTSLIAQAVFLSPRRMRDAIAALSSAGIIRAVDAHRTGWWFDTTSHWSPNVEALARMYETSRSEVLELVTRRVLETVGASTTGSR